MMNLDTTLYNISREPKYIMQSKSTFFFVVPQTD